MARPVKEPADERLVEKRKRLTGGDPFRAAERRSTAKAPLRYLDIRDLDCVSFDGIRNFSKKQNLEEVESCQLPVC